MARATNAEKTHRIMMLAEAIVNGLTSRQCMLRIASSEGWNLSTRQVDTYVSKALAVFKERAIADVDTQRRKRVKRLEHLMHVNYAKKDFAECRHNIKAISDLEGLIQSRFRDEDTPQPQLAVVSRFQEKWDKAGG